MVQTCGISEKFKIVRLSPTNAVENFDCGDRDLTSSLDLRHYSRAVNGAFVYFC